MRILSNVFLDRLLDTEVTVVKSDGTQFTAKCKISQYVEEESSLAVAGVYEVGTLIAVFKSKYSIAGIDYTVDEGDQVVFLNQTYDIVRVIPHLHRGEEILREAILERSMP